MPYLEDGQYVQGDGWVPGVDFDPSDPDEMEVMQHVWAKERAESISALQEENSRLRGLLEQIQEEGSQK